MARIPGLDTAVSLVQAPTEALAALPAVLNSLTAAARGLGETVEQARQTLAAVQRTALRLDRLVDELEQPLRDLAPGLARLAVVLDDPVIDELPDTLGKVRSEVLPVLRTLADTHERVALIAGSTERIMAFVDDTGRTLAHLPGAALLGRRRPAQSPARPGSVPRAMPDGPAAVAADPPV